MYSNCVLLVKCGEIYVEFKGAISKKKDTIVVKCLWIKMLSVLMSHISLYLFRPTPTPPLTSSANKDLKKCKHTITILWNVQSIK